MNFYEIRPKIFELLIQNISQKHLNVLESRKPVEFFQGSKVNPLTPQDVAEVRAWRSADSFSDTDTSEIERHTIVLKWSLGRNMCTRYISAACDSRQNTFGVAEHVISLNAFRGFGIHL